MPFQRGMAVEVVMAQFAGDVERSLVRPERRQVLAGSKPDGRHDLAADAGDPQAQVFLGGAHGLRRLRQAAAAPASAPVANADLT